MYIYIHTHVCIYTYIITLMLQIPAEKVFGAVGIYQNDDIQFITFFKYITMDKIEWKNEVNIYDNITFLDYLSKR